MKKDEYFEIIETIRREFSFRNHHGEVEVRGDKVTLSIAKNGSYQNDGPQPEVNVTMPLVAFNQFVGLLRNVSDEATAAMYGGEVTTTTIDPEGEPDPPQHKKGEHPYDYYNQHRS